MTKIYEQFDTAFKNIRAAVITDKSGNMVAKVCFKFGNAVTCYLHIFGLEMARGVASGGGYDRKSSAAYSAVGRIKLPALSDERFEHFRALHIQFADALAKGAEGSSWDRALIEAGFNVLFAI